MFRSKDSTITDDDIDAILAHGAEKTEKGKEKLSKLSDVKVGGTHAHIRITGCAGGVVEPSR